MLGSMIMKEWLILFVLLGLTPLYSQQSTCETPTVVVSAVDQQGFFIRNLHAENFRATVRGKEVLILAARQGPGPGRVVIVLDVSSSMNAGASRQISRYTSGELVHSLSGHPDFALVVFAKRILQTIPFGHSRNEVMTAIDNAVGSPPDLLKDRQPSFLDALLDASNLLTPRAGTGDSVVLASNGGYSGDRESKTSMDFLERAFWAKGIRIFVFEPPSPHLFYFYGSFVDQERSDSGPKELRELAEVTGGSIVTLPDSDGPRMFIATHNVEDRIANYYVVQFAPSLVLKKAEELRLELVDTSGKKRKDAELLFPHELLPCVHPPTQ